MAIQERELPNIIEREVEEAPKYYSHYTGLIPSNESARRQQQEIAEKQMDIFKGFGKSIGNMPAEFVNIFAKHPRKIPYEIKGPEQEAGAWVGDIATFGLPGKGIRDTAKVASKIPGIGKNIGNVINKIKSTPWLKNTLEIGRRGSEAAIMGERKHPQEDIQDLGLNFGFGAGTQTLANMIANRNPLVSLAARMGMGGLAGQITGHPYAGAVIGGAIPSAATFMGLRGGKNALAEDMLSGLTKQDVSRAVTANERLGTSITPAQASGNYPVSGREGALKRSTEGGQEAYRAEQTQQRQQTRAINNTLDKIYKPTPQKETEINNAYDISYKMKLPKDVISLMRKEPILDSAFKTVASDPAFKNIPTNGYEFLAEVEKQLYRDQQAAYRNNPSSAHIVGNIKKYFSDMLKKQNPDYAKAKALAQPRIVRRNMEDKLNLENEDYSAKNFYKKFLEKRKDYQTVLRDTKNFPEAQQALKDMRNGWKHLSNIKMVSQSESQAKTALDVTRNSAQAIIEALNKLSKGKGDVQRLKYIYGGEWKNDFDRLMKIQNKAERNRKLLGFFGRIADIYEIDTGLLKE